NTGSVPLVSVKRVASSAGVRVQPAAWSWQLAHERPFPNGWKKGLVVSIEPAVVNVADVPLPSVTAASSPTGIAACAEALACVPALGLDAVPEPPPPPPQAASDVASAHTLKCSQRTW